MAAIRKLTMEAAEKGEAPEEEQPLPPEDDAPLPPEVE
jgi:hypothetical protein